MVLVDGGYTYDVAGADIANFARKIVFWDWLVMDASAFALPGTTYSKGHGPVAPSCGRLSALAFCNVIKVRLNRAVEKI